MKSKFLLASIGIAAALMFSPVAAFAKTPAADPASATPEKTAEKPKKETYPLYGEVVAITPTLLTIKGGKGKEDRKFDITPETKIVDAKKPATVADIKVGRKVGGMVKKAEGSGNPTALDINVGVKQETTRKKGAEAEPAKTGAAKTESAATPAVTTGATTTVTPTTTTAATTPPAATAEPKTKSRKKKKPATTDDTKAQ